MHGPRRTIHRARFAASVAVIVSVVSGTSRADERAPPATGTAAGTLLGAEVALTSAAVFDVDSSWPYWVAAGGGAAAGAYAGYLVETRADRDVSLYALAAGLALIFPTAVWVGNARVPEPPTERLASHASTRPRGVVTVDGGGVRARILLPDLVPTFDGQDVVRYGVDQRYQLRLWLLGGRF